MIIQPKREFLAAPEHTLKYGPGEHPGDMIIECVATSPTSAVGRTVYLHVPAVQVEAVRKAARHAGIVVRSHAEGET
jgi:hypothetical protein